MMSNMCDKGFLGRYKFYNARKGNTLSYIDWAHHVVALAEECRFKTNLNVTLRDRFITGLPEGPILNRLLQEDVDELKFIGAVEIAIQCDIEVNERKNANELERKLQKYQTNDDFDGRSKIVSATSMEISDIMVEKQLPVYEQTVIKEKQPKPQQTGFIYYDIPSKHLNNPAHVIAKTKDKPIEDINLNKQRYKFCASTASESKPMKYYHRNVDRKRNENDYNRRFDFDGSSSSSQGRLSRHRWRDWSRSRSPERISPNKRDRTRSNSPNHNKDVKRRKIDYNSPNISRQSSPCRNRIRWHDSHKDEDVSKFKQIGAKVEEIEGDLFKMPVQYSLGHCVAEDMKMGKGIALGFRKTFKRVDELLEQREEKGGLAVLKDKGRFIYYLVTKTVNGKPTYGAMWNSLQRMKEHIIKNNVKNLALPRLGCGLDRLEWNVVKKMLEDTFSTIDIKIIVCNFQQKTKQTFQPRKEQYQRNRRNNARRFNY